MTAVAFLPLAAGCVKEKPPAIRQPAVQAEVMKDSTQAANDSAAALVYVHPPTDTVRTTVKAVRLSRSIASLKRLYDSTIDIKRVEFSDDYECSLSPAIQKAVPPLVFISFNTLLGDTAVRFSLLDSYESWSRHELGSGVLNFYAFRNIVARLDSTVAESTLVSPGIFEIRGGPRPAFSLYFLPALDRWDGWHPKPIPAGKYLGGQLALGLTYDFSSRSVRSGTYLLLEPGVPNPLENRKLSFTSAYFYQLSYRYHASSGSSTEPVDEGLLTRFCRRYLMRP